MSQGRTEADKLAQQAQAKMKEDLFFKKEEDKRIEFMRQQAIFEQELLKFKNSRFTTSEGRDGKVHRETDWDVAKRKGTEGSSAETTAWNSEWKIAMLGLVAMLVEFNKALNNTVTEFLMTPKFILQHKLLPQAWEKISSPFRSEPEAVLPHLLHEVKINDKNALEVRLTQSPASSGSVSEATYEKVNKWLGQLGTSVDAISADDFAQLKAHPKSNAPDCAYGLTIDNGRLTQVSFDDQFKRVVVEWLKEEGYRPDPDPTHVDQFVNSKGEPLTAAALEALKNDPDHGLQHFLQDNSELSFRPRM